MQHLPIGPRGLTTAFAVACLLALSAPAEAQTLRWASQSDALTFDPHSQNVGSTSSQIRQVYESLVQRNPDLAIEPGLAVSWTQESDSVWTFELRPGVTFHDGTPFTADDVVFSLERASGESSDFKSYVASIAEAVATGPLTVQITTTAPNPLLLSQLTNVFMMSRAWAEANGVVESQNFKEMEETFTVRNANGTGPYVLESRIPGTSITMSANPTWWGADMYPREAQEIVFTPIPNDATRTAALLSGEIDFLFDPPTQDLARIMARDDLQVVVEPQIRTIFFGLNQSEEAPFTNSGGPNPFADKRVREAVYYAIDEQTIVDRIMRGNADPVGIVSAPGVQGWDEKLAERRAFDEEKARALMAEAGYADGFTTKIDCPNDRYVNDEAICQAVVGMLARIGIDASLETQTASIHFTKIRERQTDFYMMGWGIPTLDSHYVFSLLYGAASPWNGMRFEDARMEELIAAMASEMDPAARDAMIAEAWQIALDDVTIVPLHNQVLTWAMSDALDLPIQADDTPQFRFARFSK